MTKNGKDMIMWNIRRKTNETIRSRFRPKGGDK